MESNETELNFLYLFFDLIILNIAIAIILSVTPFLNGLNIHDISLYLLHANMSAVIAYSALVKRNLYLHDNFLNRVRRIGNRLLVFVIVSFITAQLFLPKNYSYLFIVIYIALFYVGELIFYYFLYTY